MHLWDNMIIKSRFTIVDIYTYYYQYLLAIDSKCDINFADYYTTVFNFKLYAQSKRVQSQSRGTER